MPSNKALALSGDTQFFDTNFAPPLAELQMDYSAVNIVMSEIIEGDVASAMYGMWIGYSLRVSHSLNFVIGYTRAVYSLELRLYIFPCTVSPYHVIFHLLFSYL